MKMARVVAITILFLGLTAVVFGAIFVGLGVSKDNQLRETMRVEHVTLGIESELEGEVIDSLPEAQEAGDTIREHRRGIAASYKDLLGDERYNPTNPQHLTYAQALNLENYLYLAVVAFGLTQSVIASGVFMLVTGLALGGTGVVLYRLGSQVT